MEFYNQIGKKAIGSRLRMLTDKITEDAAKIYKLYDLDFQPKWFPVFHTLSLGDSTITSIATQIGHSHPSVSKIVREMIKDGVVSEKKNKADKRHTVVGLSAKGKEMAQKIQDQYKDVDAAIEEILLKTRNDLWKAIEEWEYLLNERTLYQRVQEQRKKRESSEIKVIPYESKYHKAFKELNEEWISNYFELEDVDRKVLNNPKTQVLDKGGFIFVALLHDEPVGVCALVKIKDPVYQYELAKMAVRPDMRGKNIGWLLGQAAIKKAKSLGASHLYLESNTILKPAIHLYQKMGFKKVVGHATPYKRCNIQMELKLKP
jgi:GNAT superfamily N-acetyltransferase/DNA-binding MarR family transcriptional regulator